MKYERCVGTVARMWSDNPPSQFVDSLAQLLLYTQRSVCAPGEFINYTWALSSYHENSRNVFADDVVGDWIFMTDTDHIFAPDLLVRLLRLQEKYNTRVLSGIYTFKYPPHYPVANVWGADLSDQTKKPFEPLHTWDQTKEVIEIGPTGGGCLLVKKDVFQEIRDKLQQNPFGIIPGLSEDYSFFWRCKELKIPTYLAPHVQSHHLMPRMALDVHDYIETVNQNATPPRTDPPGNSADSPTAQLQ